jgi:hypothetical protein
MVFILFNVEKEETKQKQGDVSVINAQVFLFPKIDT